MASMLAELDNFKGIIEESSEEGTIYTFLPLPAITRSHRRIGIRRMIDQADTRKMIGFKIQEITTDHAKFKILSTRLHDIVSNFNNDRTNRDLKKWTSIKHDITNLIKIYIQETTDRSQHQPIPWSPAQQILTKTSQTKSRPHFEDFCSLLIRLRLENLTTTVIRKLSPDLSVVTQTTRLFDTNSD